MTPLQKALQAHNDIEKALKSIADLFKVKIRQHPKFPSLYQFTYSMIESPKFDPVVASCRGHILDASNNWRYACRPFDRFYGLHETSRIFDWSQTSILEKLDGSLVSAWYYQDEWCFSTKGSPNAAGSPKPETENYGERFKKLFDSYRSIGEPLSTNMTYCFEYTAPDNRIVIPYSADGITLLSARDNLTGTEFPVDLWADKFPIPKKGSFENIEKLLEYLKSVSGFEVEGFVLTQLGENPLRAKVKSLAYLASHSAISSMTTEKMLEIILREEIDTLLPLFPDKIVEIQELNRLSVQYMNFLTTLWDQIKDIDSRKEFALTLQKEGKGVGSPLYNMRSETQIIDVVSKISIPSLLENIRKLDESLKELTCT